MIGEELALAVLVGTANQTLQKVAPHLCIHSYAEADLAALCEDVSETIHVLEWVRGAIQDERDNRARIAREREEAAHPYSHGN